MTETTLPTSAAADESTPARIVLHGNRLACTQHGFEAVRVLRTETERWLAYCNATDDHGPVALAYLIDLGLVEP